MKKVMFLFVVLGLTACQPPIAQQYVANMYAKGTLKGYENVKESDSKQYARVQLTVDEVLGKSAVKYFVKGCRVSVIDSLGLINVSAERYIPAMDSSYCVTVFEQERDYLKSMGFTE